VANPDLVLRVRVAWWFRYVYAPAVMLMVCFCRLFDAGVEPNAKRVKYWLGHAVSLEVNNLATKAKRWCSRCKTVHAGECPKREAWAESRRQRKTKRLTGRPWRRLRDQILERDNYLCQEHYRQGKLVAAAEVDHIVAVTAGGNDDESNLEAICTECHKVKTQADSARGRGL
jgi:5-methylcytosine-specific restriction protein A